MAGANRGRDASALQHGDRKSAIENRHFVPPSASARPADASASYASNFRDGIFAISLVRSLAAAGEVLADYLHHVGHVIQAFTTCRFSIDDCRLQGREGDCVEEQETRGERQETSDHGPGEEGSGGTPTEIALASRLSPLVSSPAQTEPSAAHEPSILLTLASALAQVSWRRLRASLAHAAWERREVVRLFRQVSRERERGQAITEERLTEVQSVA